MSALIALAVVVSACTSGDDDEADATTTTTSIDDAATSSTTEPDTEVEAPTTTEAAPLEVGTFVDDDAVCDDLELDVELTCGYVIVPADHGEPDGERLRLAVVRLSSTSSSPEPDPVVYLEGGPGGNAIDGLRFGSSSLFEPLLATRDVVVVDQRGVGRSDPVLDCPEIDELGDAVNARADRTDEDEDAALLEGLETCFERFRDEGIDPAWFTTPANADDIDLVREALGIERWNLFGISYGTRLGLEVLRRHPEPVRSAVLDSVLPPEADVVFGSAAGFEASFEAVAAACGADPDCASGGSLGERLAAAVADLDAAPRPVTVVNPLTLEELDLFADGDLLLGTVGSSLYDPTLFVDLPELLDDLEAGATEALATYLSVDVVNRDFVSVGMFTAVACADEVLVEDALPAAAGSVDELWVRAIDGVNVGPFAERACAAAGIDTPAPDAGEAVESDVPTLVLSGEFDPITPPAYGREAAGDLSASVVIEHPFLAHATASDPCVAEIIASFVEAPDTVPDCSCIDDAAAPDFTPEGLGDLTLVAVTAEPSQLGPGISAEVPDAWLDQDVGFGINRARLRGILDVAALSIFAGGGGTMDFLIDSVTDVLDDVTQEEPLTVDGTTWERTTGRDRGAVVDLLVRRGDTVTVVVLSSAPDERDELVDAVIVPLLPTVEVVDG